jgi:hypothetical protein
MALDMYYMLVFWVFNLCAFFICGNCFCGHGTALSRSRHCLLGRGLPAKNDNAVYLTYRVGWFAGKPRSNDAPSAGPAIGLSP